jgi:hypothetical protein
LDYERFALILDSERSELGRAAVRLLELGIDVLYANDVDEAALLARQESHRLGAVLVPSTLGPAQVGRLAEGVCSRLEAGAGALVLVGLEPAPELASALAAQGARWCLWEPYDERELRFVAAAAMATGHRGERRKELRLPTCIETAVFMGRHRKDVVVHDLSSGGAYLAAEKPFLEGSPLSIDIPLPEGSVVGRAEVVNAKTFDRPGRSDVPEGMGVVFKQLPDASQQALRGFLARSLARFRLVPEAPDAR